MLFNSLDFAVFLPLVFILYWFVFKRWLSAQNGLLLVASYVFYAWWDWRFLGLIVFSTLVDYAVARGLVKAEKSQKRKLLLGISLICNLGLLGFFKYYNFFVDSWVDAWGRLGVSLSAQTLSIILPVGISFYTFQTLSYTIDVYRKQLKPTTSMIQFATYVAFFPQLVAGPIERAKQLLPQFATPRVFNSEFAIGGVSLIIWGLFKKMVVADNCAFFVNQLFAGSGGYSSAELFLGAVLFAFQIYGDFSGYSDIAIGVARLFGFRLMTNFAFPYFSRDIAEFWRRWHISLSTWFRDYVYIPLGGSRGSKWLQIRNVLVVFIVSGFWHGANWTFIVWGGLHALLFLPLLLQQKNRQYIQETRIQLYQLPRILYTFVVVCFAWVFFRADSLSLAWAMLEDVLSFQSVTLQVFYHSSKSVLLSAITVFSILVLLFYEYRAVQNNQREVILTPYEAVFIAILLVFMGVYKNPADFIYFQF
ncbi:D-alanyl-lipoteichoic acid acyltransferase DltB, MBOAT superfamily [Bizionia echini]|uniref:D-alanyl-lipoteichoic acid acyltransferase DltB, MBOAT superfamily n=1 Tax=Bizionia echini TaxID=649333 RepID=A0A1I5BCF7_9FLAO|nr:MBOAT family O-acyltransferase [Bizionia echini]SFN72393.1 D-alanyl-lipoteichoic acid acyltransferase DltB, MBOAT superfamily [Bizionia echini]